MIDDAPSRFRLFYTHDGVLTLIGPSIPETRGVAALALLRYLPILQTIHFAQESRSVLEYNEATDGSLDDVYVLTTREENLCLQDLVQTIMAEEATSWNSLQQQQKRKVGSRADYLFNACVLVVGSTFMSTREKQNLVVSDLNSSNKSGTDPAANFSFYEALYMCPVSDSKQAGDTSLRAPKLILPGCVLLIGDVHFSMKVPQFPKLMIKPQSQVWNLQEDLPHDWSLTKHREATRLFSQLKHARMRHNTRDQLNLLGSAVYSCCFQSMHLKPLSSELLSRAGEIYKKTVVLIDAEIADPNSGVIRLQTGPDHGNVSVIVSEVYRGDHYLADITTEIARLAQQRACVLVLLSSNFQQDFIAVANAPNKFLLYIRDPFESMFTTSLECSHDDMLSTDSHEPPLKCIDENKPTSTLETAGHEAQNLVEGPPLTALLPPYAITSRGICYSVTPDPLISIPFPDISEELDCGIEFSNLILLWHHIQGCVYPYHHYTKLEESQRLVYSSSSSARILSTTTLLIDAMVFNDSAGQEKAHIVVPHSLFHELFLQIIPSSVNRGTFELTDPETGTDLRDELPCLWPQYVLCTIHKLKVSHAKSLVLRTKIPLPPYEIPLCERSGLRYLLDLDISTVK